MIVQQSPETEPEGDSIRQTFGTYLMRALLVLSLMYYVALMVDLVLHPLAPGSGYAPSAAVRFLVALAGTNVILIGFFIMRKVPGNRIGGV